MNWQRLCGLLALLCAVLGYAAGYGWFHWLYGYGYSMGTLSKLMWYGFFMSMAFCGLGNIVGRRR